MDLPELRAELRHPQHVAQLLPAHRRRVLRRAGGAAGALRALLAFVERFGPVRVNVNKTRISFQGRARFATVARVTKDGLVCTFWVKRRLESPRFTKIDAYPRSDHVHSFRLTDPAQLDDEAAGWIAEAYEVGMQRWRPGL
jgi:hypothetical protein